MRKTTRTHGKSQSREYKIWCSMKRRCHSPDDQGYPNYGARGIFVCERWRKSFVDFIADLGPRPSRRHSLERLDNAGPYSPENCRWGTDYEQSRNKRTSRYLTFRGRTMVMNDWCKELGIDSKTLRYRLGRGWSVDDALTVPPSIALNDPRTLLNYEAAKVIRWEVAKGTNRRLLAELYGVSYHAINDVVQGRTWT